PSPFGSGLGNISAVGNADFRRANGFHTPDPYSEQWDLTVERDLGWNTGLRVSYIGSHTLKLVMSPDLNQIRPNTVGYATAKAGRPFPNWAIVYSRDAGPSAQRTVGRIAKTLLAWAVLPVFLGLVQELEQRHRFEQ